MVCLVDCAVSALIGHSEENFCALPWCSVDLDFAAKLLYHLLVHTQAKPNALGCD